MSRKVCRWCLKLHQQKPWQTESHDDKHTGMPHGMLKMTNSAQVQSRRGGQAAASMIEQAMTATLTTCGRLGAFGEACRAQAPNL